jgi:hypothetical protein
MINISIDLNKVDKTKLRKHANGALYYNLTIDELREVGKFGETHTVYESQTKEEREKKVKRNYVGNGKEFKFAQKSGSNSATAPAPEKTDDLPF